MFDQVNSNTFKDLQNLIATKMKLVEAQKMPPKTLSGTYVPMSPRQMTPQEKQKMADEDARLRAEWEAKNPDEAKVFAERERLANESSAQRKQAWEKQQAERKQWWSNPQNEKKAIEWDAKNPRPESGYAVIEWRKRREKAGIMDREETEFRDVSTSDYTGGGLSKPWKPKLNPFKPRPYM
jgi:hypothetical protein